MAEIYVTSTADSGAGSLRQAIADAQDGDVILFDSDVFPVGETTSILLSSYITVNKSVSVYGGFSDGQGGYTSGATKRYYVYRDIEDVQTKVYIDENNPALEGETVLFDLSCRVALDGQSARRCLFSSFTGSATFSGIAFIHGQEHGSGTSGGGASMRSESNNLFSDCYFYDCLAASGAGFHSLSSSNTLNNCVFENNSTNGSNGGIYLTGVGNKNTFNDCVVVNCTSLNGGGICTTNSTLSELNRCVIFGCSASNGGGFYSSSTGQNMLNDCTIKDCHGTTNGAGIYTASTSQNTFNNCIITGCQNDTYGGGLFSYSASRNILNGCQISDCSANMGAGVYSRDTSQNTLNDCIISGCSATSGGGVYTTNTSQNTLNDCTITGCSATNSGGAARLETASINTLNSCVITNCSATVNGGGIYAAGTTQNTINNCNISNCASAQSAGGLALYNANGTNVVDNCVISDNIGSDTSRNDLVVAVTNGTIIKSSVIGSWRLAATTTVTISDNITTVNSIFFGVNTDGTTSSIVIDDGAALTITNSASVGAGSISSEGRGYLAVAAGINVSAATLTNVVLCAYGADVSSFAEVDGVLEWEAANPTTTVLIERADGDSWTTVTQTAGENLTLYLPPSDTVRLFDGVQFFTATAPDVRTYYYIGDAEGSFTSAGDWSLRRGGVAITEPPVVAGQRFIVGDISSGE